MIEQNLGQVAEALERVGVPADAAAEAAQLSNVPGTADVALRLMGAQGVQAARASFRGGIRGPVVAGDVVRLPRDVATLAGVGRAVVEAVEELTAQGDGQGEGAARQHVTMRPCLPGPCSRAACAEKFAGGAPTCDHGRTEEEALASIGLVLLALVDGLDDAVKIGTPARIWEAQQRILLAGEVNDRLRLPVPR